MSVKLLTEHHLEFLSLLGGCTCLSKSTHVKMPHCWKSHVTAHMVLTLGGSTNSSSEDPTFSLYEYIQTNIHINPKEPNR